MRRGRFARATLALWVLMLLASACADVTTQGSSSSSPTRTATASASTTTSPLTVAGFYGTPIVPPLPEPDFTLTDQHGKPFRFGRDAETPVTLLYFGYTHCADICPGTLAAIAVARQGLPEDVRAQIGVVFVTVDPARDTPDVLRDYVGLFSRDFVGLSGSGRETARILAELGLPPATRSDLGGGEYAVGHPPQVLAFTSDGYAHLEFPFGTTVEALQHDLQTLVEEGGVGS
jgi:protein SCO1